jgi:hypothetical protein
VSEDPLEGVRGAGLWLKEKFAAGAWCVEVVLVKKWVEWVGSNSHSVLYVKPDKHSCEEVV